MLNICMILVNVEIARRKGEIQRENFLQTRRLIFKRTVENIDTGL